MTINKIKSNDIGIFFTSELLLNEVPINISGCTINFLMKRGDTLFEDSASIIDAENGEVSYMVQSGFPTTPGTYYQEWEVIFPDSSVFTFPSDEYNKIEIVDDLN